MGTAEPETPREKKQAAEICTQNLTALLATRVTKSRKERSIQNPEHAELPWDGAGRKNALQSTAGSRA